MAEENVPSLRDTISSAVETVETSTPSEASPPPSSVAPSEPEAPNSAQKPPQPDERPESSPAPKEKPSYLQEAKKDNEPEKLPAIPKEGAKPEERPEDARARVDRPPQSWKGEIRNEWNKLPLPVRQEVLRRERDIDGQLRQYAGLKSFSDEYARTIQPYLPRLNAIGTNPIEATKRLFEADRLLSTASKVDRAQYLAKIIQDYDIDIPTLDGVLSGKVIDDRDPANVIRQEIQQALQPVFGFMQEQQNHRQSAVRQQQEQADQMVGNMSMDPDFPYYEDLREDMADIIDLAAKRGVALTLPQAYARAAAAHPEIGPIVVGDIHKRQMQQTTAEAQRAKSASVSVGGAPTGSPPTSFDPSDLRAALEHSVAMTSRRT